MSHPTVGQQLRQARQAKPATLADVTRSTKIQPWVLESLEEDRLQETMSPVYAKNLLTSYARFLQLDPHPLIAQLYPAPAPAAPAEPAPQAAAEEPAASWPWEGLQDAVGSLLRRLAPVGLVVAAVAVIWAAKPLKWLPSLRITQASFSVVGSPATPDTPSSARTGPIRSPASSAVAQQAALAVKPSQPLELVLVARRGSWISVKTDGDLVAQQQLAPGSKESWTARRRIELVLGHPAQVDVLLNGHSISPMVTAHRGRIAITHKGVTPLDDEPQ